MPLYRFHFNGLDSDAIELELADDNEAWTEAVTSMCELLKDDRSFAPGHDWHVEVRTQDTLVYKLTVSGR